MVNREMLTCFLFLASGRKDECGEGGFEMKGEKWRMYRDGWKEAEERDAGKWMMKNEDV
jgi:hypothetical protein